MAINHPFWDEARQLLAKGRAKQALPLLRALREKFPAAPELRYSEAFALQELGQLGDALPLYEQAVDERSHASWHVNYGFCLLQLDQAHKAEYQFALALRKEPKAPDEWLINYAIALKQNGKLDDAEAVLGALANRSPNNFDGILHLASLLNQREKHRQSLPAWKRVVELAPSNPVGYANLGAALFYVCDYVSAEAVLRAGIAAAGKNTQLIGNLACAVLGQNRIEEALTLFELSLSIEPDKIETIGAAIGALHIMGLHDKAAELLERGIDRPDTGHEFRFLLSTVRLMQQRFDEGWALNRERWKSKHFRELHAAYEMPEWRGEPLQGKNILVMAEQGLADQIQALAFLPELQALCNKIAVEIDGRLIPIAQRSFPDVLFYPYSVPQIQPSNLEFDYYVAMGDLAGFFRHSLDDFAKQPRVYLQPDAELVQKWRERLPATPDRPLRVGLSWRSLRIKDTQNGHAYPPLEHWIKLLKQHPDVEWVNLQYDKPESDLASFEEIAGVKLTSWPDIDIARAQDDLAAMFQSLDLVLGVANAPVFLAAVTGVPTWSTWTSRLRIYWKTHGLDYMPWMPDIRLFQRRADTPWEQVFDSLSLALGELKAAKRLPPA